MSCTELRTAAYKAGLLGCETRSMFCYVIHDRPAWEPNCASMVCKDPKTQPCRSCLCSTPHVSHCGAALRGQARMTACEAV